MFNSKMGNIGELINSTIDKTNYPTEREENGRDLHESVSL